jgi:hypothetical protein
MKNIKPLQTFPVLNTMTRSELRRLAIHLGVRRGRNRSDTIRNLSDAITLGKARLKSVVTIETAPLPGNPASYHGKTLFCKKFRTYKADKVLIPVPPVTA